MPDRGPDKTEWPRYFTCAMEEGTDGSGRHSYYVKLDPDEAEQLFDGWGHRIVGLKAVSSGILTVLIRYHLYLTGNEARQLDDKLQQMRGYIPARRVQQDRIREFNR